MPDKIKINKNTKIIIYKLLNDMLFITMFFFAIMLIADGALPGIITDRISFLKIVFFISLNLSAIYIVGKHLRLELSDKNINKKTTSLFVIFAAIIIGNNFFKLNIWLAVVIISLALTAGYYIGKNTFENSPNIKC